jgi:diaminohydroxyphosphoribosylaminopyrimidine deaminase/5-amino-6-(5-phosphoribosylamino)uracil reductase
MKEEVAGDTHYIRLAFDDTILDALLQRLKMDKRISLFVEGGAALLNSFINAGLWDEARVFTTVPTLGHGIVAPALPKAQLSLTTDVGSDTLRTYQPEGGKYPCPAGALL